jgi:heme-degrading monooxygenase HmoA
MRTCTEIGLGKQMAQSFRWREADVHPPGRAPALTVREPHRGALPHLRPESIRAEARNFAMSAHVYLELDAPAKAIGNPGPGLARLFLGSSQPMEAVNLNARAVEFIAKAGREHHLRNCMRREVAEFLTQQTGFAGIFVLTSHKEPRLIRVLSLWETAPQATENHWEDSPAVRRLVTALIDVRVKVHTYEAELPESAETSSRTSEMSGARMC